MPPRGAMSSKKAEGGPGRVAVLRKIPLQLSALSAYRLLDGEDQEIESLNEFLDMIALRGLSERTVRTYGYCLLDFWKWLCASALKLPELTELDLLEYIAFQHEKRPTPRTVNLRLTVVHALYRFHVGEEMPSGRRNTKKRVSLWRGGRGRDLAHLRPTGRRLQRLSVKAPRRVVVPLRAEEVDAFLQSLRTWRDLSMVALMLFCGLRSREVLSLKLEDLYLMEGELRVWGKGNKQRLVPLAAEVIGPLQSYLSVERPEVPTQEVFLCLKGPRKANPLTLQGLRSLFRYHRKLSEVPAANPHRFRHTFGADMARAGISIVALMKLMGHGTIDQTLCYVELSAEDVRREFLRVVELLRRQESRCAGVVEQHG